MFEHSSKGAGWCQRKMELDMLCGTLQYTERVARIFDKVMCPLSIKLASHLGHLRLSELLVHTPYFFRFIFVVRYVLPDVSSRGCSAHSLRRKR